MQSNILWLPINYGKQEYCGNLVTLTISTTLLIYYTRAAYVFVCLIIIMYLSVVRKILRTTGVET